MLLRRGKSQTCLVPKVSCAAHNCRSWQVQLKEIPRKAGGLSTAFRVNRWRPCDRSVELARRYCSARSNPAFPAICGLLLRIALT
jgi:hypothetical protein